MKENKLKKAHGYARPVGTCNAFIQVLWGVVIGLQIAWDLGLRKLMVECDSKALIDSITNCS